jgi:hypothetical protein
MASNLTITCLMNSSAGQLKDSSSSSVKPCRRFGALIRPSLMASPTSRIVAFRNVLIHGYASVDYRLVWGVIERDVAILRASLGRLLETGQVTRPLP